MRSSTVVVLMLSACLWGQGCGGQQAGGASPEEIPADNLSAAQKEMRDRALAARNDLFSELGGRLALAISESGPASAISVCAEEATRISVDVSQEHGLAIGRTSFRLRNPGNEPPEWAKSVVASRVEHDVYLDGPRGGLRALLPIHMKGLCVTCHGGNDEIPADVKEALARNYPGDKATGFAPGELRGWYWVEVEAGGR